MAAVYLAQHRGLGRRVALKVLAPELAEDERFRERFLRESRVAAALDHPNVVPVYDAGEVEGLLFIAMRFVDGIDLRRLLDRDGVLETERALVTLSQVAAALDTAHELGLIHRDVKPGNILIAPGVGPGGADHAYLADFGLARAVLPTTALTEAGTLLGTLDYLSPEQIEGLPLDARTDVYALACVAFECLVGEPPFRRPTVYATVTAHLREPPPTISAALPELPSALDAVIAGGLAKRKDERPRSAGELVASLRAAFGTPRAPQEAFVASVERRLVTVLSCDLPAGTPSSIDPEDVEAAARIGRDLVTDEVRRYGGVVEGFVGTTATAVFGVPAVHEDDPERAVRAALRILEEASSATREGRGPRAGIATGEALVRHEGGIADARVAGAVVEMASALREAAVECVLVAEATFRAVSRFVDAEELPPLAYPSGDALSAWRVLGSRSRGGILEPADTTPFRGREDELELLRRTFARSQRESSVQLVTLVGDPGIGKTRLVREFAAHVDARSELVTWRRGRCLAFGEDVSFWALSEIVKTEAGILESDDPAEAAIKLKAAAESLGVDPEERDWLVSRLGPLVGLGTPEDAAQRSESFAAWLRFIERMALRGPLILVLEDLHWAGKALLDFLEELLDGAANLPLFLLCTARGEFLDLSGNWGGGRGNSTTITLAPLADEATNEVLDALLTGIEFPPEGRDALVRRIGGNPLFAEELVRMILDRGLDAADLGSSLIPETIQAVLEARLDALPMAERELLQDAAVVGSTFWLGALVQMDGRDVDVVDLALHELERRELVRPIRSSSVEGDREFAFRHVLVRDVAYGEIPRAARIRKHRRAALWMETMAGDRAVDHAEVIADHFEKALELAIVTGARGEVEALQIPTRKYLELAGDRAAALDPARAHAYLTKALTLAPARLRERAVLQGKLGAVYRSLGDLAAATSVYREAVEAFRDLGSDRDEADALLWLSSVLWLRGETIPSRRALEEGRRLLERLPRGSELAGAWALTGYDLVTQGKPQEALGWIDRALDLARNTGADTRVQEALDFRGIVRMELGDAGGLDDFHEAKRLGLSLGSSSETARTYANLATALSLVEGAKASFEVATEGCSFAERRGFVGYGVPLGYVALEGLLDLGRWDEVVRGAIEKSAMGRDQGATYWAVQCETLRVHVLSVRGDLGEAEAVADKMLPDALEMGDPQVTLSALGSMLTLAFAKGDLAAARDLAGQIEGGLSDQGPRIWGRLLPALARVGAATEDVPFLERILAIGEPVFPRERFAHGTATAVLRQATGDLLSARHAYTEAAEGWTQFSLEERARALFGAGLCGRRLGEDDASDQLREARALSQSLGVIESRSLIDLRRVGGDP